MPRGRIIPIGRSIWETKNGGADDKLICQKSHFFACLLVFALHGPVVLSQQGSLSRVVVLKGARVIDGFGGAPVQDGIIVVEGDRIRLVDTAATSDSPDGTVVDLSGKFIIPVATPKPEISAITPHTVVEGNPEFEMTVEGVGFVGNSVVKVSGITMPTTFVDARTLKVRIPSTLVEHATPNPFSAPGPYQSEGIYGDRTVPVTVYNAPPDGGLSNSVSLRIRAQWIGDIKH